MNMAALWKRTAKYYWRADASWFRIVQERNEKLYYQHKRIIELQQQLATVTEERDAYKQSLERLAETHDERNRQLEELQDRIEDIMAQLDKVYPGDDHVQYRVEWLIEQHKAVTAERDKLAGHSQPRMPTRN